MTHDSPSPGESMCVYVHVRVQVRVDVDVCVHACVRACACAYARVNVPPLRAPLAAAACVRMRRQALTRPPLRIQQPIAVDSSHLFFPSHFPPSSPLSRNANLLRHHEVRAVCFVMRSRSNRDNPIGSPLHIFTLLAYPDARPAPILDFSHYCAALAEDDGHHGIGHLHRHRSGAQSHVARSARVRV